MTVTVRKIGGSVAVVIPKAMAREMELTEGTPLSISGSGDSIVMRKAGRRPRRRLRDVVAKIKSASYTRRNAELLGDGRVGREQW